MATDIFEQKAYAIASKATNRGADNVVTFDPLTILSIISALISIWQFLKPKFSAQESLEVLKKPNRLQAARLNRILRQHLGDKYYKIGKEVSEGVKEIGKTSSLEEAKEMYNSV